MRLRKFSVTERELLRGMPSVRVVLNKCAKYNVVFNFIFFVYLIVEYRYVAFVELFESIHHIAFFNYM